MIKLKVEYFNNDMGYGKANPIEIKFHTFKSGEEHVTLIDSPENSNYKSLNSSNKFKDYSINGRISFTIFARIDSSAELMRLLLVTDAIKRTYGDYHINLIMPYIPYARQDRACIEGDAFSLKVFANIINSQNYNKVLVADSHSMVATALINNIVEITQKEIVPEIFESNDVKYDYIIAPDAGASKKVESILQEVLTTNQDSNLELIQALKVRNKEGQIVSTKVLTDNLNGKNCLIVDDICAAGGTFIGLAKALKEVNAGVIGLYVTHGGFDNGINPLLENGISHIYTTDSLDTKDNRVNVIKKFFTYN